MEPQRSTCQVFNTGFYFLIKNIAQYTEYYNQKHKSKKVLHVAGYMYQTVTEQYTFPAVSFNQFIPLN
jgi:N-acetyl-gamma-glutamylphosphate reductase